MDKLLITLDRLATLSGTNLISLQKGLSELEAEEMLVIIDCLVARVNQRLQERK